MKKRPKTFVEETRRSDGKLVRWPGVRRGGRRGGPRHRPSNRDAGRFDVVKTLTRYIFG